MNTLRLKHGYFGRVALALLFLVGVVNSLSAAIAFRAASSASTGGATATSVTVSKPAGVVSGDVMIAAWDIRTADGNVTAPGGWTLVRTIDDPTFQLKIYWKKAGTSEPGSYTWSYSLARLQSVGIVALSGVDGTSPIQVQNGTAESGTTTSHTTPSISVTGSTSWLVAIFGDRRDGGSTWSIPAGMNERLDVRTTSGTGDVSIAMSTQGPVAAGSYAKTSTASGSSAYAGMALIAVNAAGGGGGGVWTSPLLADPTKTIVVPPTPTNGVEQDLFPAANVVYDARGKAWLYGTGPNGTTYPLGINDIPNGVGFTGGKFNSNVPDTTTWHDIKGGLNIDGTGLWSNVNGATFIVEGCHFDHQFDGLRIGYGNLSAAKWNVRHCYFKTTRDDGIQNDSCLEGTIDDCLFDGVFMMYSERPGSGAGGVCSSPQKPVTMTKVLARLDKTMAYFHEGHDYGHGAIFKMGGNTGPVNCSDCVWVYEDVPVNGPSSMAFPAGTYVNCTVIWMGAGNWPGPAIPNGVTLIQHDDTLWQQKKADWLQRHGWNASTGKFAFELP